jgi:hypothetical protein
LIPKNSKYGFTDNYPLAALVAIYEQAYSLTIVSEDCLLGSGGSYSKRKALRRAESAGVHTNLDYRITHRKLKEIVDDHFG